MGSSTNNGEGMGFWDFRRFPSGSPDWSSVGKEQSRRRWEDFDRVLHVETFMRRWNDTSPNRGSHFAQGKREHEGVRYGPLPRECRIHIHVSKGPTKLPWKGWTLPAVIHSV